MEKVLQSKIDALLKKIEENRKRKEELESKIYEHHELRLQEEQNVLELHLKLQNLEGTLRDKERETDRLKLQLRDEESENDGTIQCMEREKKLTDDDIENGSKLKQQYGDILISSKILKTKAEEATDEIYQIERKLCEEDESQMHEAKRIENLDKEMNILSQKLNLLLLQESDIRIQDTKQREKIKELKAKYLDADKQSVELQIQCRKLESLLDSLTQRLHLAKEEYKKIDFMLKKQKLEEKERTGETTLLHRAQLVKRKCK